MQLRQTTCLIFIVFGLIPKVFAQDGKLTVPPNWFQGQRIDVACEVSTSKLTTCTTGGSRISTTVFRKNTLQVCTVALQWEGKCLTTSPDYFPDSCWCEQESGATTIKYVYRIWGNPQTHNGTWTCEKGCTATGNFAPTLFTIDNTAGEQKMVSNFKTLTCDPSGGYPVLKGFEMTETVCVCDKNREIGTCGPCTTSLWMGGYCTGREQVPSIIALVVILVLVLTLNALYFGYGIHKQGLPLNKQRAENTHQKNYAVETTVQKDEPSGASSLESASDYNDGSTVGN